MTWTNISIETVERSGELFGEILSGQRGLFTSAVRGTESLYTPHTPF
jgi:hypothetical protein